MLQWHTRLAPVALALLVAVAALMACTAGNFTW